MQLDRKHATSYVTEKSLCYGTFFLNTVFWSEILKGADHLEDLGVDGRIILEWSLGKYVRKVWTGFIWLRIRTIDGLL
jgi:hypothetical protein